MSLSKKMARARPPHLTSGSMLLPCSGKTWHCRFVPINMTDGTLLFTVESYLVYAPHLEPFSQKQQQSSEPYQSNFSQCGWLLKGFVCLHCKEVQRKGQMIGIIFTYGNLFNYLTKGLFHLWQKQTQLDLLYLYPLPSFLTKQRLWTLKQLLKYMCVGVEDLQIKSHSSAKYSLCQEK